MLLTRWQCQIWEMVTLYCKALLLGWRYKSRQRYVFIFLCGFIKYRVYVPPWLNDLFFIIMTYNIEHCKKIYFSQRNIVYFFKFFFRETNQIVQFLYAHSHTQKYFLQNRLFKGKNTDIFC